MMKMKCRQCEETIKGTGCTKGGVCGKSAELADAQDLLVQTLIVLSKGAADKGLGGAVLADIDVRIVDGLFMTLTNTNFDIGAIKGAADSNKRLKSELGIECHFCASGHPAEGIGIDSYDADDDLRSLKELLLAGMKGLAAYYHHATVLGFHDATVTAFLRKGLAALRQDLTADELVALNMECGSVGVTCLALLDLANTKTYGVPEPTAVHTGAGTSPGILGVDCCIWASGVYELLPGFILALVVAIVVSLMTEEPDAETCAEFDEVAEGKFY